MDAADALEQLFRVSDDLRAAVVFAPGGEPLASNLGDDEAAQLAATAVAMLSRARTLRRESAVRQLRAATPDGDVYILREGERAVVAVTNPGAHPGLVRHDLRSLVARARAPRRKTAAHA